MEPKARRNVRARNGGLFQHRIMTREVRHVVTNITDITARPASHANILGQKHNVLWIETEIARKLYCPFIEKMKISVLLILS